jgi:hypothetical protein
MDADPGRSCTCSLTLDLGQQLSAAPRRGQEDCNTDCKFIWAAVKAWPISSWSSRAMWRRSVLRFDEAAGKIAVGGQRPRFCWAVFVQ